MSLPLWQRVVPCRPTPRPCSSSFPSASGLPLAGCPTSGRGLPTLGSLPACSALPMPLPLPTGLATSFEPGARVCSATGAFAAGSSVSWVSSTVSSVRTVGSEVSSPSSGSEDAPGEALASGSSATVAPEDVASGAVDPGESSRFGPPAKIRPSWAADTPATANRRITRVVMTTARYMEMALSIKLVTPAPPLSAHSPKRFGFLGGGRFFQVLSACRAQAYVELKRLRCSTHLPGGHTYLNLRTS